MTVTMHDASLDTRQRLATPTMADGGGGMMHGMAMMTNNLNSPPALPLYGSEGFSISIIINFNPQSERQHCQQYDRVSN